MTNVIQFTGITTLPLDPNRLLEEAKGKLQDVVILGFDADGDEYFASSKSDAGEVIYHLERAKHRLMKIIDALAQDAK